jgi:hypothetical protein
MGKNLMQVCTSLRNKEYYAISDDEMASWMTHRATLESTVWYKLV